jgi:hypothetical protein
MKLRISPDLTRKLIGLPETGMGYQLVDLVLDDGRMVSRVMVFNAEVAEIDELGTLTADRIVDVRVSSPPVDKDRPQAR